MGRKKVGLRQVKRLGVLTEMMEEWANTGDKWVLTFIWRMKTLCLLKQSVCLFLWDYQRWPWLLFYPAYKKTQWNFMSDSSLFPQIWFGANYSFLTIPLTPTQSESRCAPAMIWLHTLVGKWTEVNSLWCKDDRRDSVTLENTGCRRCDLFLPAFSQDTVQLQQTKSGKKME